MWALYNSGITMIRNRGWILSWFSIHIPHRGVMQCSERTVRVRVAWFGCGWLDTMTFKVFSNASDSMTVQTQCAPALRTWLWGQRYRAMQ